MVRLLLYVLPVVLYAIGVCWLFILHPLVSISTGELKPRSLFVDEHALPVQSSVVDRTVTIASHDQWSPSINPCEILSPFVSFCLQNSTSISFTMESTQVPSARERIFVGLIVPTLITTIGDDQASVDLAWMDLIYSLAQNYRSAKWVAKQTFVHIAPSSSSLHEFVQSAAYDRFRPVSALTREAYLLDLSELSTSLEWKDISLIAHDHMGTQPNMDLVSYTVHVHPHHGLTMPVCAVPHLSRYIYTTSLQAIDAVRTLLPADRSASSSSSKTRIRHRLEGYTQHLCARIFGLGAVDETAHGDDRALLSLQQALSHFLRRNVDAIALRFHRVDGALRKKTAVTTTAVTKPATGRASLATGELSPLKFVYDLLYGSNYLEEELHHSYHFYLLMGDQTFVGMSEFGLSAVVLVLSVVVIVLRLLHGPTTSPATRTKEAGQLIGHGVASEEIQLAVAMVVACHLPVQSFVDEGLPLLPFPVDSAELAVEVARVITLIALVWTSVPRENTSAFCSRVLRYFFGAELVTSVVIPLLYAGVQDVALFYSLAIVAFPVVFSISCLVGDGNRSMWGLVAVSVVAGAVLGGLWVLHDQARAYFPLVALPDHPSQRWLRFQFAVLADPPRSLARVSAAMTVAVGIKERYLPSQTTAHQRQLRQEQERSELLSKSEREQSQIEIEHAKKQA